MKIIYGSGAKGTDAMNVERFKFSFRVSESCSLKLSIRRLDQEDASASLVSFPFDETTPGSNGQQHSVQHGDPSL